MSYDLTNRAGHIVATADCLYDFNYLLAEPFPEPEDGDWHALDDEIEAELHANGLVIHETNFVIDDDHIEETA